MSLDVRLKGEPKRVRCVCLCGHEHESEEAETLFSSNITHNLGDMAEEAGVYDHLWCPENVGISKASELIEPLRNAVAAMKADPDRFKKHNAPNGWGMYEHFVPWVEEYLEACKRYPDARVEVSR